MELIQVTLGTDATPSGATPILPTAVVPSRALPFQWITVQANGSNNIRIGDSSVSATRGILVAAGGGSVTFGLGLDYGVDLYEWYIYGTSGDVVDIMLQR